MFKAIYIRSIKPVLAKAYRTYYVGHNKTETMKNQVLSIQDRAISNLHFRSYSKLASVQSRYNWKWYYKGKKFWDAISGIVGVGAGMAAIITMWKSMDTPKLISNVEEPVEFYLKREEEQDVLNRLGKNSPKQGEEVKFCYLKASGGSGKTQIAKEYASTAKKESRYNIIFWFNCENVEEMKNQLSELAHSLELDIRSLPYESIKNKVINELIKNGKWLLIFDNIDTPDSYKTFKTYLPNKGGHVLVTGRYFPPEDSIGFDPKDRLIKKNIVDVFLPTRKFSKDLLKDLLKNIAKTKNYVDNDLEKIINFLSAPPRGASPLAMLLVANYLKNHRETSIRDFIKNFDEFSSNYLASPDNLEGYQWPIRKMWDMSIKSCLDSAKSKDDFSYKGREYLVEVILNIISCYGTNRISGKIISAKSLSTIKEIEDYYRDNYPDKSEKSIKELIKIHIEDTFYILRSHSLIESSTENDFEMNPLLSIMLVTTQKKRYSHAIAEYRNRYKITRLFISFPKTLYLPMATSILENHLKNFNDDLITDALPLFLGLVNYCENIQNDIDNNSIKQNLMYYLNCFSSYPISLEQLKNSPIDNIERFVSIKNKLNPDNLKKNNLAIIELIKGDHVTAIKEIEEFIQEVKNIKPETELYRILGNVSVAIFMGASGWTLVGAGAYIVPIFAFPWLSVPAIMGTMVGSLLTTGFFVNKQEEPEVAIDLLLITAYSNLAVIYALDRNKEETERNIKTAEDIFMKHKTKMKKAVSTASKMCADGKKEIEPPNMNLMIERNKQLFFQKGLFFNSSIKNFFYENKKDRDRVQVKFCP